VNGCAVRDRQQSHGRIAALGNERLVAESAHHILKEPSLHGIVIDDQNTFTHYAPSQPPALVPIWRTVAQLG